MKRLLIAGAAVVSIVIAVVLASTRPGRRVTGDG